MEVRRAGWNWRTTVAHPIKQNARVPDVQKLQIIQLCREKQRESIKSHDEHFTQTRLFVMSHWYTCITICMDVLQRGHPLPMADTVLAQGEQKQTLTNNKSCQRKRDAVSHCATLLHCRQCHCSFEMVLQNPVLHFPVLHFQRPLVYSEHTRERGTDQHIQSVYVSSVRKFISCQRTRRPQELPLRPIYHNAWTSERAEKTTAN